MSVPIEQHDSGFNGSGKLIVLSAHYTYMFRVHINSHGREWYGLLIRSHHTIETRPSS